MVLPLVGMQNKMTQEYKKLDNTFNIAAEVVEEEPSPQPEMKKVRKRVKKVKVSDE